MKVELQLLVGLFFFLHGELYTELGALCTVTSKVLYLLVMY